LTVFPYVRKFKQNLKKYQYNSGHFYSPKIKHGDSEAYKQNRKLDTVTYTQIRATGKPVR